MPRMLLCHSPARPHLGPNRSKRFHFHDFRNRTSLLRPQRLASHPFHIPSGPAFHPHSETGPSIVSQALILVLHLPTHPGHRWPTGHLCAHEKETALQVSGPLVHSLAGGQHASLNWKAQPLRQALTAPRAPCTGSRCTAVCWEELASRLWKQTPWTRQQTWANPQPGKTITDHFVHCPCLRLDKSHKVLQVTPIVHLYHLSQGCSGSLSLIWTSPGHLPWESSFKPFPHLPLSVLDPGELLASSLPCRANPLAMPFIYPPPPPRELCPNNLSVSPSPRAFPSAPSNPNSAASSNASFSLHLEHLHVPFDPFQ